MLIRPYWKALVSEFDLTSSTADATPSSAQSGGLWLSLERLRQLPLDASARLALLQEAMASMAPEERERALPLIGELAELHLRCCEEAFGRRDWSEALQHHDALLQLVDRLVSLAPEHSQSFWGSYGELLAFFTGAVHAVVMPQCTDPPPRPERAELAWQLAQRLTHATTLPLQPPDWLPVLEQQLVLQGAFLWRDLLDEGEASDALTSDRLRRRSLELLMRLHQLFDPPPEWIGVKAGELVAQKIQIVLSHDPPEALALVELLNDLERLPVAEEQREALTTAVTRARLALELLDPSVSVAAPASMVSIPQVPTQAIVADAVLPSISSEAPPIAELVLLEAGATASPLRMDVGPLLEAEFSQIDAALDDFIWHLPKGSRARSVVTALPLALQPHWRQGRQFAAGVFERLAYLAAAWQRRLNERLVPLPQQDWRYGMLVELATSELEVLAPLLASPDQLEAVLAELRREHHNPGFWQQRLELPWMACAPPMEALRRLHVEAGFYAHGQQPMQSLHRWGKEVLQTLNEAELWTDDCGCLGRWLLLAQEQCLQQGGSLPELGQPPSVEHLLHELGGQEVIYVGDGAAAIAEAHRAGRCFRGDPFGLRVLETPASRWPARPGEGFEQTLAVLLESVETLYRQRPFAVLLADCGAYRLPLLRAVHQRYGVAAISSGRPMTGWLASP